MNIYWHDLWDDTESSKESWNPNKHLVSENKKLKKLKASLNSSENSVILNGWRTWITSVQSNCGMVVISCDYVADIPVACSVARDMGYSVALYTLADYQLDQYHDELIKLGFICWEESKTLNTRSDNVITTYMIKLHYFKGESYAD